MSGIFFVVIYWRTCNCLSIVQNQNIVIMKTTKNIIGLGVITGVVVFAFLRSFSTKMDRKLVGSKKAEVQLT